MTEQSDADAASPKNAARLLYERMRKWQETPPFISVLKHRAETTGEDWWRAHVKAVGWLEEVAAQLERLRRQDPEESVPFTEAVDRIRSAVFAVDSEMVGNYGTPRVHLPRTDLPALHLLSMAWHVDQPANPGVVVDLMESAREITDLLMDADDLDQKSREYMLDLVMHLQQAIAAVAVRGTTDVERLADQLIGAMVRYLSKQSAEQRTRQEGAVRRLIDRIQLFLGLVPPTVKAIESATSLFDPPSALPPGP